jgi:hypothetical protein
MRHYLQAVRLERFFGAARSDWTLHVADLATHTG